MPDYKESTVAGTSWQRCHTVKINNPYDEQPFIEFLEEKVITLEGQSIKQWIGQCEKPFVPTDTFPLLDPVTNTPTGGTMTHGEFYAILYSLYMQTAQERDAANP